MRRICLVVPKYYPDVIAKRSAEALVRHGDEVDVICLCDDGQKKHEVLAGANVYRLPVQHRREGAARYLREYTAFFVLASAKLAWLKRNRRYDLVEVYTMPDFMVFTAIIPKLLGTKIVLYMLEYMPELFASKFETGDNHLGVRLLRFLEGISAKFADHVMVVCEPQRQRLHRMYGVPTGKVTVILNVPDNTIFDGSAYTAHEADSQFRVITHGNMFKRQGVQTLIRAVPLLLADIPELRVDIVGNGEYLPALKSLSRELGVDDHVKFTGYVPLLEVPRYISEADVGVVAHLYDLMLPIKAFEYLAMSKPVVAPNLSHMTTHFGDSRMLFFNAGDERDLAQRILELYRDPESRAELSRRGHELYETCDWRMQQHTYLNVHERLLA